jgi:UDP-glucuronate decarboxylase
MLPDDGRVVSNFIVQALKGEDITLYGDGSQTRSFCYMDDLLEGMIRMMEQEECVGPINIGNPKEFTIRELAETILKKIESSSTLIELPLPSDDPMQRKPDISQAQKLLDWSPKIELEEGLDQTIPYFQKILGI